MPRTGMMPWLWGAITLCWFILYLLTRDLPYLVFGILATIPEAYMIYKIIKNWRG